VGGGSSTSRCDTSLMLKGHPYVEKQGVSKIIYIHVPCGERAKVESVQKIRRTQSESMGIKWSE